MAENSMLEFDTDQTCGLLEEAGNGSRQAFDRLFALHRAELRQFIAAHLDPRLRTRFDSSDVVQETQMEAYERFEDFLKRHPMSFRLWLRKTARQRLGMLKRKHLRAARRTVAREVPLPERSGLPLTRQLMVRNSSPSETFHRAELARRVHELLNQLPEADHEILAMRTFEGKSYEELACLLDIDPAAARKRYGRALLKLHRLLVEPGALG